MAVEPEPLLIVALSLSPRSRRAVLKVLSAAGIEGPHWQMHAHHLCNVTAKELLSMKNFGVGSLAEVRAALAAHGLSLRDEPSSVKKEE